MILSNSRILAVILLYLGVVSLWSVDAQDSPKHPAAPTGSPVLRWLNAEIGLKNDRICLKWSAKPGFEYILEESETSEQWNLVARLLADNVTMNYCFEENDVPKLVRVGEVGPLIITNNNQARASISTQTNHSDLPDSYRVDDRHKLTSGDRVSFQILEDKKEPLLLTVTDSGELVLPYLGRVVVRNRTCQQVVKEITPMLEAKYYYRATVILAVNLFNQSRGTVYVVGAVARAGRVDIPSAEEFTLSKAILSAGGFSDFADKKRVRVVRKRDYGFEEFTVNVGDIWKNGRVENDVSLESGDQIFVPERLISF